jgi:iron(III) transport system permease protein
VFITVSGALGTNRHQLRRSREDVGRRSVQDSHRRNYATDHACDHSQCALLAFVGCISNFGIPALLGFRARFFVLTTRDLLSSVHTGHAAGDGDGGYVGDHVWACRLFSQRRLERRQSRYTVIAGKSVRPQTMNLGAWRIPDLRHRCDRIALCRSGSAHIDALDLVPEVLGRAAEVCEHDDGSLQVHTQLAHGDPSV